MKKLVLITFLSVILFGCKYKKNRKEYKSTLVESYKLKTKIDSFYYKNIFDGIKFIDLKEDKNNLFRSIDKIIVNNDYIYIFDRMGSNKVYKYNLNGDFISAIGNKGRGPEEYIKLNDFDIKDSLFYLNDVTGGRILIYNSNNKFIKSYKLPFHVYNLKRLNNGNYLFYILKNNSSEKIILTDNEFNLLKVYVKYDKEENEDQLYWPNTFRIMPDENILCTLPYNDTLYFFSQNGDTLIKKSFDFGKYKLPNEIRINCEEVEKKSRNKTFMYFTESPVVVNNYLIASIIYGQVRATLFYDTLTSSYRIFKMEANKLDIKNICWLSFANSNYVIDWFDYEIYNNFIEKPLLSEEMIKDLENGNRILCFRELKK